MGLILLMGHAGNISHPQAYLFIYTACMGIWGEMQVEFSWVQSCRWQEQHSCGMLLFTTDYPDWVSMSCFSCKAALLNLAYLRGLAFSAQMTFVTALLTSNFLLSLFSYWSPTPNSLKIICHKRTLNFVK
jgi:hypothetical protein